MVFARGSHPVRVWRSWLWNSVKALAALVFAFVGLSGMIRAELLDIRPGADDIGFGVGGLVAGLLVFRALLLRVVAKPDRLVVHTMFRNLSIPWDKVDSIDCRNVSQGVLPAVAPVVTLTEQRNGVAKVVELTSLASYDLPVSWAPRLLGRRSAKELADYLGQVREGPVGDFSRAVHMW